MGFSLSAQNEDFYQNQNKDAFVQVEKSKIGFQENKGQFTDQDGNPVPEVLFKAQIGGSNLYITENGLTFVLLQKIKHSKRDTKGLENLNEQEKFEEVVREKYFDGRDKKYSFHRVDMNLSGAAINSSNIITEEPYKTGRVDFYKSHCPNGIFDVGTYGKVTIADVYPGIDWVIYSDEEKGVKHDFVVHPGADPGQIQIEYLGADNIILAENQKSLTIKTSLGEIKEGEIFTFQDASTEIFTHYAIDGNKVRYKIENYDKSRDLIIDPPLQLWWSTYFGGSTGLDGPEDIAIDGSGNVFITGYCGSASFPKLNPGGTTYYQGILGNTIDAFISKFSNTGVLLWSTYYGGNADDRGEDITVDPSGNVYVTGSSASTNFPLQVLAGAYNQAANAGGNDVMILKFSNTGTRLWATTYGGNDADQGLGITTDAAGNVYVTGYAGCNNFPLANPGAGAYYQSAYGGGGCGGGTISGDAFVIKFDVNGSNVWSTLLGGNGGDRGNDITVDAAGNIYVTGFAMSTNFPRLNPLGTYYYQNNNAGNGFLYGDVFITKFNAAYNMQWSTYYGGNYGDSGENIKIDGLGNIWVCGSTASSNFPLLNLGGAYNQAASGGPNGQFNYGDWFILKFDPVGTRLWSTYYGGIDDEVAHDMFIDKCNNVYVAGYTTSNNFPTFNPGGGYYYDGIFGGATLFGDAGILSFNNNGVQQWGTYYGGTNNDWAEGIVVDFYGSLFVAGEMQTGGGVRIDPGGGAYYDNTFNGGTDDGLMMKFIPVPLVLTPSQTNVTCYGLNNGTATVNAAGGVAPYTYSWNTVPTQTTSTAVGLAPGNYTCTVFDANCSIDTISFTITQPPLLQAFIPAHNNVLCYGGNTGWASATQLGGTPSYAYAWAPTGQTTSTASNLSAGTYTVTITDNNDCIATATVTITQPPVLTITVTAQTNVLCNGANNGSATIAAGGGTPTYAYSWSNGQTGTTSTGLSAGTYTATVTDNNGCTAQATVTITQPPLFQASVPAYNNVLCFGGNTGSATASQVGGTAPYNYSWNPTGQTTITATNLAAGTYTVTITDNNGCTSQNSVTITQPPVLTVTITAQTNVLCNGGANGSATAAANGGTPGYFYSWSNGQTGTTSTGLSAGTYTATVTDNNGCIAQTTVTITQPLLLQAFIPAHNNILCNGGNTGWATASQLGGTSPYTYLWSPAAQTTATATNLTAGTYTILITDNNGCTASNTITITQPPVLTASISVQTNILCNGGNTGNATVSAAGGTPGYNYSWSNGQTGITASNLSVGLYIVTVTDNNGCTAQTSVNITEPPVLTASISAQTNVSCNGSNNASATVIAAGGTPNYNYLWSNGQTNSMAIGLTAGTYTVTVMDNNGCTAQATVTITQPPVLTASISAQTNILCNGNSTGSATVMAGGGSPGYNYNWSNGQTNSIASNLAAGTYTAVVTDNNGCTAQAIVSITEPPLLTLTLTPTNLLCNNIATGQVNSNVQGGTSPYMYSWSTAATTNNISNQPSGTYTLTITDNNGCTIQSTATITEPSVLTITITSTPDHCSQGDGTATIVAQGGTPAYTYSWSNGQTVPAISNLSVGTYTATITDNNGCSLTNTVNVLPQASDTLQIVSITNTSCNGNCDGAAILQLSGSANGPYTYAWNTLPQQTSLTATGLCAGIYTCTVTDGVGCQSTIQVTITQPSALTSSIVAQTNALCNGSVNGSVTIIASGGTPNYLYSWNNGQTNATASNLAAGIYTATITDNNGCVTQITVTITEPPVLSLTLTAIDLLCNNIPTGQVISNVQGGTSPYTYNWNTAATTNNISNQPAGNYTLTVNDNNGCTIQSTVTITEPSALTMTLTSTPDHCNQGDGTAAANVQGGTPSYNYSWSNGQITSLASNLSAGTYTAIITDNNGCSITSTVSVSPQASDTLQIVSITNASCNGSCDGYATLQLSGAANGPYTYAWNTVPQQTLLTATGLCAGIYTCTVTDANGCTDVLSITITQPVALSATLTASPTICFGGSTGSASVSNVSGGNPAYSYNWSTGHTSSVATGLVSGNYSVTITDNNGCSIIRAIQVTDAPQLIVNIAAPNPLCEGQQAILNSNAAGGTAPYNYLWNTGQTTVGITTNTLTANTGFTVVVADNNGCTAQATVLVTVNSLPVISFISDVTQGCVPLCVNFNNTTPGTQSLTWNFGDSTTSAQINPVHCYTSAGNYHVTLIVTDNNGCSNTLTQNNYITVHPNPVANFTATPQPTTILNPAIYFSNQSQGSTSWLWTFGDVASSGSTEENPNYTYGDTGTYYVQLIAINEFGCSDTIEHPVRIEADYILYIPNTFTPNGDNRNEEFKPFGIGIDVDKYEFWIFDRWGDLIFKSTDPSIGWDGKANGGANIAQQDTYVWKIATTDVLGQKHRYVGHVNLIR